MLKTLLFSLLLLSPNLIWAQDSCSKSCVIDSECGTGGRCDQGRCHSQKYFCTNERWSSNERGESSNCDAYRCDSQTGLCLRQAKSPTDCLLGYVYDEQGACVPTIQCNPTDSGCQDLLSQWQKLRSDYEASTPEPALTPLSCVACENSESCGSGMMCWQKRCVPAASHCESNLAGDQFQVDLLSSVSCGNYTCEKVLGQCLKFCLKESDCRNGRKCVSNQCL
jgi:hypothetical protein